MDLNDVTVEGETEVIVPAQGLVTLKTGNQGPLRTGSVVISSDVELAGVVVFEGSIGVAGVNNSAALRNMVAPVETGAGVNTGVAIVSLATGQTIQFALRDEEGSLLATASELLAAKGHFAKFVDQFGWNPQVDLSDFSGSLTAAGTDDFTATVIRQSPDQIATLPVADPAAGRKKLYFAQFGDGSHAGVELFSQITLLNLNDTATANVTVEIRDDEGDPLQVDFNGTVVEGTTQATIPPGGVRTLKTDGEGSLQTGSVVVTSDTVLEGVILFSSSQGLAGVGSSQAVRSFVAPVETASDVLDTGVAMMGLGEEQTIQLELRDQQGNLLATSSQPLGANAHVAKFVTQYTWDTPPDFSDFTGTLTATGTASFAATLIRQSPEELATLPVSDKNFFTPLGSDSF